MTVVRGRQKRPRIAERLRDLRADLAKAAKRAGRPRDAATLVAVSRAGTVETIEAALHEGQRAFGEVQVPEALAKFAPLRRRFTGISLHLIGALKAAEIAQVVAFFDVIHSLDQPELAAALAQEMTRQGRYLPCFIQVNSGEETGKRGVSPSEVGAFIALCREQYTLPLVGLMCDPPEDEHPGPHFALLQQLAHKNQLNQLSMGESHTIQDAIYLGATHVRIGTALFGSCREQE